MATNSVRGRDGGRPASSVLVWMLAGLAVVAGVESASGAEIQSNPLTSSDLGRPFVLDQRGRRIALRSGGLELPSRLPAGVAPTYLAYRLGPRSHAPDGTPIVTAVPRRGEPVVGPLRLDALAKASLDAELAKTGQVALMTPRQSFLVESWGGSALSDLEGAAKIWRAEVEGSEGAGGGGGSVGKTDENWLDASANAIKTWNQQVVDAIKGMFKVSSPKPVIIPPKTVAAQTLYLPAEAEQVLPAPVPEPGSLIVFAVGATIAAWRFRPGRRTRHADPS